MGQAFACFLCGFRRNDKVVPLSTENEMPAVSSPVSRCPAVIISDFYRSHPPQEEDWPCDASSITDSSISSNGTSMATISLGSRQTISTTSMENLMGDGHLDGSSSHFRRPGLWTPEPPDVPLFDRFDFPSAELDFGNTLPPLTFGSEAVRRQTSEGSLSRFAQLAHTSPSRIHPKHSAQSSSNASTSSSRHTRAATPRPRGPMLIKVQPLRRQDSDPALRVCKHGVVLKGDDDDADSHEVSCVRCERPQSKGGRMLHQMMQNRKKEKLLKRQRKEEKKRLMEEERERRRQATQAIDNALQKFVELQRQKEETK